jgi:hypothetical protein
LQELTTGKQQFSGRKFLIFLVEYETGILSYWFTNISGRRVEEGKGANEEIKCK